MLGLAACQNEPEGLDVNVGGEQAVTINVTVPETETRAGGLNSALGVFDNGVLDGPATMRYILKIYDAAGVASHDRQVAYSDGKKVAFDVRLVPDRDYTFVVWADVVTAEADVDNHYDTSDLTNVTLKGEWVAMDESRDAFTTTELIKDFNGQSDITLNLKRPFAKLRVVSTDTEFLNHLNITPVAATLEYTTEYRPAFNAVKGTYAAAGTEKKTHEYTIASYNEDVANGADRTLFTDYIFADNDIVKFNLAVYEDAAKTKLIVSDGYQTDINVKRNHLTTIKGNLLTDGKGFEVTVVDGFDGYITEGGDEADKENIVDLLKANEEVIEVTLTEDVELSGQFTFGGADTKSITINGTAYTRAAERPVITLKSSYNYYFRAVNPEAKLYLNDVDIVIVDGNGANTWDVDDLLLDIDVEANNVKFDGAVALDGCRTAKFDGCSFNETRDYYAMWICPQFNKNVTIANSAFVSPRGIKIDDQYIEQNGGTVTKTTLNVSNTSFKTAKKAAILVKSSAGADITLENIDITEVAADPINAVWVDEDAKQYADLVTVKGGTKVIEGSADTNIVVVSNADELKTAISNASATEVGTIYLKGGYYAGYFLVSDKKILLTTTEDVTIDGLINLTGNTAYVGVRNMTLTNANPQNHYDSNKYLTRANGYIFGVYNGSLDIQDCIINVVATGAINQHADVTGNTLTVKNTTFNCNGQRPIRARANVNIESCTFVDQQRYAVQSQFNNTLSSQNMVFINNKIINPCVTSGEPFAAGVQISHSQICENVAFTIANNELTSTKFNDLKFAYDHEEGSSSFGNIKITTCTLNGQPITEAMCFEINEDTNEVSTTMTKPEVNENVFTIKTAKELFWFANEVNVNNNSFSGKTVKLDADIDLENAEWTPVGQTGATQFKGTFDGQDHTIYNLNINRVNETGANNSTGLFGWLNAATVKNVTVDGATVTGNHNVGVIAGYLESDGCTIDNCHVIRATVECHCKGGETCGDKAGGILGSAWNENTPVKNCTVTDSTISAGRDAGQVVGAAVIANVTNCSATNVTVTANGECTGANVRNDIIGRTK